MEFSRMVFHMRRAIEQQLEGSNDPMVPKLAMGEAFANQIAEAFFAICEQVADLDENELKVAKRLRNEVREEISRRNHFAHGDWWIGFGKGSEGDMADPTLWRTKPGRDKGAWQITDISVAELDELSDSLFSLRQNVSEFGSLCLGTNPLELVRDGGPFRVSDIFRLDKKTNEVVRDGPRADEGRINYS